jgi:Flp pilus assembly protein TadG
MAQRKASDAGQAVVELAIALPVLCLLLLGAVQVVAIGADQLVTTEAARVGARAAAVAANPAAAGAAAVHHVVGDRARVSTATHDGYVTVTVMVTNATDVALIGTLLPDVELTAQASMLLEPP